ncbi:ROK family protein [Clostridium sp. Mt-5]|uniref:Glucokinase n=1 Tax=Clostridium moutaii TaxID=3240932 RepID=A0ABV4BMN5_9CLOT
MKDEFVVGVDLGGTKICAAVINSRGKIIYDQTLPTKVWMGKTFILNTMITLIEELIQKCRLNNKKIKGIGVGSPGPLDISKGEIICAPNLPFKNFDIITPLKDKFNIPVYLDNDANAAALGEYMFGAGRGSRNMIFITVSTGIGGGAVLNGNIYRGNTQNALEVGHMTLEKDGPLCNCGNRGCAEVLASGTAIAREAKRAVNRGEVTSLSQYENVTSREVFKEAELGDDTAKRILDTALNYLGICVANVMNCFDPDVVVIGGGVSKGGSIVIDRISGVVKKRCFKTISENTKILQAELGTYAGVIGAAALVIMGFKKNS